MIYLYNGSGAAPGCVDAMKKSVIRLGIADERSVVPCDFSAPLLDAKMVLIPGGHALQMVQGHFTLETAKKVRSAVNGGARGVFICAGALVMCGTVHQNPTRFKYRFLETEIPVTAFQPAYRASGNLSSETARILKVSTDGDPFSVYWNLGPSFCEGNQRVVCRYDDLPEKPAAAIETRHELGSAAWSGVHPEFTRIEGLFDHELVPDWDQQEALLKTLYGIKTSISR